jgi:hypothetical protein
MKDLNFVKLILTNQIQVDFENQLIQKTSQMYQLPLLRRF